MIVLKESIHQKRVTRFSVLLVFITLLFLHLPDIKPFLSYSPINRLTPLSQGLGSTLLPVYTLVILIWIILHLFVAYNLIHREGRIFSLIKSPVMTIILLVFMTAGIHLLYHYKGINAGTDQDDAIIQAGLLLIKGQFPYALTWAGNPMSPGLGWIILFLPLTVIGFYHLNPVVLSFLVIIILRKKHRAWYQVNLLLLIIMTSIMFWQSAGLGADMISMGLAFLIAFLLFDSPVKERWRVAIVILFLGMVFSSRILFFYIPLVLFLVSLKNIKYSAVIFFTSILVALSFYLIPWLIDPAVFIANGPLHVLSMARSGGMPLFYFILMVMSFIIFTTYFFFSIVKKIGTPLGLFTGALVVPLYFLTFRDVVNVGIGELAYWMKGHYLLIILPTAAYFLISITGHNNRSVIDES